MTKILVLCDFLLSCITVKLNYNYLIISEMLWIDAEGAVYYLSSFKCYLGGKTHLIGDKVKSYSLLRRFWYEKIFFSSSGFRFPKPNYFMKLPLAPFCLSFMFFSFQFNSVFLLLFFFSLLVKFLHFSFLVLCLSFLTLSNIFFGNTCH